MSLESIATAVGLLAFGWLLHRVMRMMEDRGWIYYTRRRGSSGQLGAAMTEVHALFEPERRHMLVVEEEPETAARAQLDRHDKS